MPSDGAKDKGSFDPLTVPPVYAKTGVYRWTVQGRLDLIARRLLVAGSGCDGRKAWRPRGFRCVPWNARPGDGCISCEAGCQRAWSSCACTGKVRSLPDWSWRVIRSRRVVGSDGPSWQQYALRSATAWPSFPSLLARGSASTMWIRGSRMPRYCPRA